MRHIALAGCLLLLLACDDSLSPGGGRVRIISTVERDTIDATHDLVVEVRTPSGLPGSSDLLDRFTTDRAFRDRFGPRRRDRTGENRGSGRHAARQRIHERGP